MSLAVLCVANRVQRFSASLFQIIVDQHFVCSAWPISAASLAATVSASTVNDTWIVLLLFAKIP